MVVFFNSGIVSAKILKYFEKQQYKERQILVVLLTCLLAVCKNTLNGLMIWVK